MNKHTTGPWILDDKNHVYAKAFFKPAPFTSDDGEHHPDFMDGLIALPYGCGDGDTEANAHLIAAAPEMMEALKGLHAALARMIDKHDPDSIEAEWLQHSHEALLKAEGQAPKAKPAEDLPPTRILTCCCCSEPTRGRQWWNRDKGFGLCPWCADRIAEKESAEEMSRSYGERGVHYDIQEKK